MSAQPHEYWTEAEYLALERESDIRHEYLDGQIIAMSGASRAHNLITSSAHVLLYTQLQGCELYQSDMRVKIHRAYTYPDLVVVCGEPRFTDGDTLLNPTLIIETLSPSTEMYDRGKKFQYYRQIAALQVYVLIAQDQARVERFTRQPSGEWLLTEFTDLNAVMALPAVNCELPLAKIYEQVKFD